MTGIFEVRDGVFALGTAGRHARAVCAWNKKKNKWQGVRGRKPLIPSDARIKASSKAVKETLAALAN